MIYELSNELVRRGHSVTALTTDAMDSTGRASPVSEVFGGIEVHRYRNLSNRLASGYQLFLPRGMGGYLRKHLFEFDVAHMHIPRALSSILVHRYATKLGVPYVLSAHGTLPRITRGKFAKEIFDLILGHRILRDATRLIAVSGTERQHYEKAGIPTSKVSVIPNGVNSDYYDSLPAPGAFRSQHGLRDRSLVLYVGRMNPRKGLVHLVRAFGELTKHRSNAHLALIGPDDGFRTRLEGFVGRLGLSEQVTFFGMVTEAAKLQAYVDADVVVYTAEHEIFGLVPFEAMICGTPVVVANDSGCGEIIAAEQAGLTVGVDDVTELRDAIEQCLEKNNSVADRTARGREFVLTQLSWSKIAQKMEGVYRDSVVCGVDQ